MKSMQIRNQAWDQTPCRPVSMAILCTTQHQIHQHSFQHCFNEGTSPITPVGTGLRRLGEHMSITTCRLQRCGCDDKKNRWPDSVCSFGSKRGFGPRRAVLWRCKPHLSQALVVQLQSKLAPQPPGVTSPVALDHHTDTPASKTKRNLLSH